VDLSLFTHRFYNPRMMRWQTTDPLGFKDGLNLYAYVHNNPFCYKDPDGRAAFILPFPVIIPLFEAAFGAAATVTFLPAVGTAIGVAAIGYGCYQLAMYASNRIDGYENANGQEKVEEKKPRFDGKDLGDDPTKCPSEGFKWKGKGNPESGRGAWHNENTNESLHPDFDHPPPGKSHWDYTSPDFPKGVRLNLDGTYELKI